MMKASKLFNLVIVFMLIASTLFSVSSQVFAMPASTTDESKVPHYFGPYSNYANSPFTLPDVTVQILGDGSGAQASATVGGNGVITGITMTNPGVGYTTASVNILSANGSGASAAATVTKSGIVTGVTVNAGGAGYVKPVVSFSGGGGTGTLVQVGNPLQARAFATDYASVQPVVPAAVTAAASRIYDLTVGSASGGSFTLTVDALATAPIAWNALAADVQTALATAGITASVAGSGSIIDPWVITFTAAPASVTLDSALLTQAVVDAAVTAGISPDTFNVAVGSASGGSFILNVDAVLTAPIAWNALAADVQLALSTAGITASVTGTGSIVDPYVIVYAVAPLSVTIDSAGLTRGVLDSALSVAKTDTYSLAVGTAIGGTFILNVDTVLTAPIAWNALAADVQSALSTAGITAAVSGSGSIADPWIIVFAVAPTGVALDATAIIQPVVPAAVPVFVIVPVAMPASGFVQSIQYFNQATAGGSPAPSAGNVFHTYVLHPTGVLNEYSVLWDSGEMTVPAAVDPVGDIVTIAVPKVAIAAGDTIGFYGEGIPFDTGAGADVVASPAPSIAPTLGSTFVMGDALTYPLLAQARTYSLAAAVVDTSAVVPLVNATGTAYGGVDAVNLINAGSGYIMPTVDFDLPDDPNGVQATAHANYDPSTGAILGIVVDNPGSGYSAAPNVVIRDGTVYAPINGGSGATASATISISAVSVDTYGSGYSSAPTVLITDASGTGSGANATASVSAGGVTSIALVAGGSGYVTQGGIKKFQDGLPVLCDPTSGWANCTDNNLGQHIPIAVADTTTFSTTNGFAANADYYVIALVQHREKMSSSLAAGTLLREYVQLETPSNASFSKHVALYNDLLDGTSVPALMPDGTQAYAVDDPHYMGPIIAAQKDRAVRITFYNLLPTGVDGNLFLPVDTTFMGSGMGDMVMPAVVDQGSVLDEVRNPMCGEPGPKPMGCYTDNRATLHLHGGITPWISDGTPEQWITPAGESTSYPQGVSVSAVPDMANVPGVPDCSAATDGCMTFYYTNQQSARLMFYHDHSWGITRLNVYAGEAAGYTITDPAEQKLVSSGIIPSDQIPLIIQDKTFVPGAAQLASQDPTWDTSRWGGESNLWYEHVYMPAQNPGDPSGMSSYGRWMYGPWFWPPQSPMYDTIANPYYDPNCNLDVPSTWQYQISPYCEPALIPGTPNVSSGMEQFNDTPVVNGTAYPTVTLQPKAYRFRILNASNDRFWNLQWYVADPTTGTNSEVALKSSEVAAAQTDPNVFPTPDTTLSPVGPSWIQIGTEGGFLPAPAVIANQPITWITDPTRFDFGNVDKHSLLLGTAERADVIVDFSKYAGKTLILYNDAPAAFPARIASYDYYSGGPDLSPVGAPSTIPGYGPNTRTIMQVKIANTTPAASFNMTALNNAFKHHADGSGVFESSQNPIIVGQAAYNSAYGSSFASSSWCNQPGSTATKCDGFARIQEQGGFAFGFNTLSSPNTKTTVALQPKGIHDEMNSATFDPYGRMTANLGLEAPGATPLLQNIILYPYINPATELIDGTNLPKGDVKVQAISSGTDGTQIWKITHNGVDTHTIHFHLYDVQILNRVTWDNIIMAPDANELGWKDTIRVSPLEDTIVALRPVIPTTPFEIPNSIRMLNPAMPAGDTSGFNSTDANGNVAATITNQLVNFGWEYVYHCHILGHEEMDMMRPVSVVLPPLTPDGLTWSVTGKNNNTVLTLTWNDNSITETSFLIQKTDANGNWTDLATVQSPLDQPNIHEVRTYADNTFRLDKNIYAYRVIAQNTVGYGGDYASMTATSMTNSVAVILAPTNLAAALLAGATGPQVSLSWTDNSTNENGFIIQRSTDGVNFTQIAVAPAHNNTGFTTYVDGTITTGLTYTYRVAASSAVGPSAFSNLASVVVPPAPAAPGNFLAVNGPNGNGNSRSVILTWVDNANNETGFTVQRASNSTFTSGLVSTTLAPNTQTLTVTGLNRNTNYYFRIRASNGAIVASGWVNASPFPIHTNP